MLSAPATCCHTCWCTVLEAFLLDNFGFSSYHISGKQLASNCDALFLQMGLNYALFPCQNVSQVVAWFDPVVFFPWLLSCEHFDYATLLPSSSSLFGTENIAAYNQFRFSKGENQFSQYQYCLFTNSASSSLEFLVPLARVHASDSYHSILAFFSHVIDSMRFLEYNGLTVCQQHFRFFL